MFFEVDTGTLRKMCKTENIRYRNGCPVYLKYENQNLDESGGGEEAVKGIVLGICDIPANGNANGNAAEMRECTQDTFWYSIQLCNNPAAGSILHEVSPTKVSYRTCEIVKKEEEEEGKDEADLLDDIQVLGVKIENDDRDERDLHVPETVSFLSADQKLRESVQSLATRGKEETGHTNPEDDSNSRASKRRSLNTNSTSIGNTSIAETGFCKESQSDGLSASLSSERENDRDIPISFIRDAPPGLSESTTKMIHGRAFHWCGECRGGRGYWTSHKEDEHDDNDTNTRVRQSNGTISVDHSDASRKDFHGDKIRNNHYQRSMFKHIYDQKGSINFLVRDQTRSIPKSFTDNKTPMCIFYHVKGFCKSTCTRAIDHTETPEEKLESFLRWCNQRCFNTTDPPQTQSSPNKIFTCKIRLAVSKFNSAQEGK